jgi:hypothetical protein
MLKPPSECHHVVKRQIAEKEKNQIRLNRSNKQKTNRGITQYPIHDYNTIGLIVTLRFRPIYNYIVQTE